MQMTVIGLTQKTRLNWSAGVSTTPVVHSVTSAARDLSRSHGDQQRWVQLTSVNHVSATDIAVSVAMILKWIVIAAVLIFTDDMREAVFVLTVSTTHLVSTVSSADLDSIDHTVFK